jgi:hypothetical protein
VPQRKLRHLIPVVLCSILLVLGLLPSAMATPPKPRAPRAASVTPRRSLTDDLRRLAVGDRATHHEAVGARFKIRIPGEAYSRWFVEVVRLRNHSRLTVATYREEQYYFWTSWLPRSAVRLRRNLSGLSIHTGTQLGDFGSIELDMTHSGHHVASVERCPTTHEPIFKIRRARGLVEGAVSLSPDLTGLPTEITATKERVHLSRFLYTSNECTSRHRRCYPNEDLTVSDGDNRAFTGVGFPGLFFLHQTNSGGVKESWYTLTYDGSTDPITRTPSQLTLDAQDLGPLLGGSITFDKVESSEPVRRGPCMVTKVSYVFASGSLDANFDAGVVTLTGPSVEGTLRRSRRP